MSGYEIVFCVNNTEQKLRGMMLQEDLLITEKGDWFYDFVINGVKYSVCGSAYPDQTPKEHCIIIFKDKETGDEKFVEATIRPV